MSLPKPDPPFPPSNGLRDVTAVFAGEHAAKLLNLPVEPTRANVVAMVEQYLRLFCVLPDEAYLTLSLWIVATHMPEAFYVFPYIALLSPMKRCGKTRVLELMALLCARPLRPVCATPAVLYRLSGDMPTWLVDEVEAINNQTSEVQSAMLSILNAGYKRGAMVPRCDGPKNEVKMFPVYGPKAFAAIGGLPDTLADRCIFFNMQRKKASQTVRRFLDSEQQSPASHIKATIEDWAARNKENVQDAIASCRDLPFLQDRDAEIWLALFAVCVVAAPERVPELKRCALALSKAKRENDTDDSPQLRLLHDLRSIWTPGADRMKTSEILHLLNRLDGGDCQDLTDRKLAKYLRPFGVRPRQNRVDGRGFKTYVWSEISDALARYAAEAETSETTETCNVPHVESAETHSGTVAL